MSSIWDTPQAPEQTTSTTSDTKPSPDVATNGARERIYGTQAGPLLSPSGRGIVNGVPYGESEQGRLETLNKMYPFRPQWASRLAAATRKAIGR